MIFSDLTINEDVPMDKPFQYVHQDDYKEAFDKVTQAVNKGASYFSEFRIYHGKTKELRFISVQAEVIWKDKKPHKLVGVIKDNTATKRLEIKLKTKNDNFRHILDNLNAGFWMRESVDGKVIYASEGIEDILKVPLTKLVKQPDCWREMILPVHRKEVSEAFDVLRNGERIQIKYQIKSGDGTIKWVLEQSIPKVNSEGKIMNLFGMVTDVTAEVEMQEKLKYLAMHDTLTALPNQQNIYEKLDTICEKKMEPFVVLYLDLDRFHIINHSFIGVSDW